MLPAKTYVYSFWRAIETSQVSWRKHLSLLLLWGRIGPMLFNLNDPKIKPLSLDQWDHLVRTNTPAKIDINSIVFTLYNKILFKKQLLFEQQIFLPQIGQSSPLWCSEKCYFSALSTAKFPTFAVSSAQLAKDFPDVLVIEIAVLADLSKQRLSP